MSSDTLKTAVCDALAAWIRQRPGLKLEDYGDDVRSYRAEARDVARDKRDAETLLQAVRWRDSLTGKDIIEASKTAFGGRLTIAIKDANGKPMKRAPSDAESMRGRTVELEYTEGQSNTEYRAAAAAVLALAIRQYVRSSRPPITGKVERIHGPFTVEVNTIDGITEGDWLRRHFRREFGSRLQRRWFN